MALEIIQKKHKVAFKFAMYSLIIVAIGILLFHFLDKSNLFDWGVILFFAIVGQISFYFLFNLLNGLSEKFNLTMDSGKFKRFNRYIKSDKISKIEIFAAISNLIIFIFMFITGLSFASVGLIIIIGTLIQKTTISTHLLAIFIGLPLIEVGLLLMIKFYLFWIGDETKRNYWKTGVKLSENEDRLKLYFNKYIDSFSWDDSELDKKDKKRILCFKTYIDNYLSIKTISFSFKKEQIQKFTDLTYNKNYDDILLLINEIDESIKKTYEKEYFVLDSYFSSIYINYSSTDNIFIKLKVLSRNTLNKMWLIIVTNSDKISAFIKVVKGAILIIILVFIIIEAVTGKISFDQILNLLKTSAG
jgi:hypothetical protein